MRKRPCYKAYIEVWNAINNAVTPEQGWKIFMSCINNGYIKEPGADKLVDAFSYILLLNAEYDKED